MGMPHSKSGLPIRSADAFGGAARTPSAWSLILLLSILPAGCNSLPIPSVGVGDHANDVSSAMAEVAQQRPAASEEQRTTKDPGDSQTSRVLSASILGLLGSPLGQGPVLATSALLIGKTDSLPFPRRLAVSAVTFDQAINATLLADPKIRAGLEVINQATADLLTSSLPPNPTLTADLLNLPLTRPFTVDRQGGPPQTDYMASYPIDWFLFGKRAAAMASAQAGVRVSEADYADLVRTRVRETATAFYDALEAKAQLELARQDLESLRRVEAATRKAVDAGGRPIVELNRVRLDVLKSEQTLREAETTLAVARAKLRAQMGRRDPEPDFDVTGNLDAPLTAQPMPIDEALAQAELNRPDIRSLRLQVEKAGRDIQTERTKAYPQVTPQLGYTHQFQQKAIGFPDADSWLMSVGLPLPFFDRNQGNIAKARSVRTQNALNLESGLVDLRAEIVQVVEEFQRDYKNAGAVAEEQVRRAREVRDSIEKAYQIGGRSLLEVLDAERNYRDTYRAYITNRANYWRSVYKFSAAIGRQVPPNDQPSR
jgi:cobalt-zinc-cadmium efflux system outer membrane protein